MSYRGLYIEENNIKHGGTVFVKCKYDPKRYLESKKYKHNNCFEMLYEGSNFVRDQRNNLQQLVNYLENNNEEFRIALTTSTVYPNSLYPGHHKMWFHLLHNNDLLDNIYYLIRD